MTICQLVCADTHCTATLWDDPDKTLRLSLTWVDAELLANIFANPSSTKPRVFRLEYQGAACGPYTTEIKNTDDGEIQIRFLFFPLAPLHPTPEERQNIARRLREKADQIRPANLPGWHRR